MQVQINTCHHQIFVHIGPAELGGNNLQNTSETHKRFFEDFIKILLIYRQLSCDA